MNRRDLFKAFGFVSAAAVLPAEAMAKPSVFRRIATKLGIGRAAEETKGAFFDRSYLSYVYRLVGAEYNSRILDEQRLYATPSNIYDAVLDEEVKRVLAEERAKVS